MKSASASKSKVPLTFSIPNALAGCRLADSRANSKEHPETKPVKFYLTIEGKTNYQLI